MTIVVVLIPTPNYCQKAIKKLNNIIIAQLLINKRPNILSNTQRFNTSIDEKMFENEFKTLLVDLFSNTTLAIVNMHITNLGYLEDKLFCFTKLLDSGIEELNKMLLGLDTAAVIPITDNQDLQNLINLKTIQASKKKKKVERRWQRKINLAQAIAVDSTPLSFIVSVCYFSSSLVAFTRNALSSFIIGDTFASGVLLFFIVSDTFGSRILLSFIAGSISVYDVSCFLFLIAGGSLLSAVLGCLSFFVTNSGLLFTIFGCFFSSVTGDNLLFVVSDNNSLSTIFDSVFLSSVPFANF